MPLFLPKWALLGLSDLNVSKTGVEKMLDMKRALDLKALAASCPVAAGDYATARSAFPVADGAVGLVLIVPVGSGHFRATAADAFLFVLEG